MCVYRTGRVRVKLPPEQFEKLALEQLDMLYRIARRLTQDNQRAEDLVQDTYVRALRARESFDLQEYGIRPWLLRIMHNLHYSHAERARRQPQSFEGEHLDAAHHPPAHPPPPLDPASFEGMDERLVRALSALSPEYQVVILLWAVDGLSYKEIAEAAGVPIGTVMSRLHRARQRLGEQLHGYAVNEGIIRE